MHAYSSAWLIQFENIIILLLEHSVVCLSQIFCGSIYIILPYRPIDLILKRFHFIVQIAIILKKNKIIFWKLLKI